MGELIPIVAILMVFGIPMLAIWTSHQQKIAKMQVQTTAENTAEKAAQYASHVAELEQRVRVLERIVTDRGYDIATQIEALRDQREVEDRGAGVPLNLDKKENA